MKHAWVSWVNWNANGGWPNGLHELATVPAFAIILALCLLIWFLEFVSKEGEETPMPLLSMDWMEAAYEFPEVHDPTNILKGYFITKTGKVIELERL